MNQRFPSRRQFLVAGGAVMTTLSLDKKRFIPTRPSVCESERKIREIVKRYGSELGQARRIAR